MNKILMEWGGIFLGIDLMVYPISLWIVVHALGIIGLIGVMLVWLWTLEESKEKHI